MKRGILSVTAINALELRIQYEELSARLYEDMSLWFEDLGYVNLAKLYKAYSSEEWEHSGWAKSFLLSYGEKPRLKNLVSPDTDYKDCLNILELTLEHELTILKQCEVLAKEALGRGEIALYTLALKYVEEQIDEVDKAIALLDIFKLTKDLLIFDNYIGENYLG